MFLQAARGANRIASGISKIAFKGGLKTKVASLILPSTKIALKASQILNVVSVILGGISLILDIVYLVQVSIHIHDGSQSEVAKKMEEIADVMSKELYAVKQYMLQISLQDVDDCDVDDEIMDFDDFDDNFAYDNFQSDDDGFFDSLLVDHTYQLHVREEEYTETGDVICESRDILQKADDSIIQPIREDEIETFDIEHRTSVNYNEQYDNFYELEFTETNYESVDRELYRITPSRLLSEMSDIETVTP